MRLTPPLLAGLLVLLPATAAIACSCRPLASAAEHVGYVDAIFRGRVVASVPDPASPEIFSITTFELIAPLKMPSQWGAPPERIVVRHASTRTGPQCAIWYEPGQEVLVAARMGQDRNLHTSSCDAPRWPEREYRQALHLAPQPQGWAGSRQRSPAAGRSDIEHLPTAMLENVTQPGSIASVGIADLPSASMPDPDDSALDAVYAPIGWAGICDPGGLERDHPAPNVDDRLFPPGQIGRRFIRTACSGIFASQMHHAPISPDLCNVRAGDRHDGCGGISATATRCGTTSASG